MVTTQRQAETTPQVTAPAAVPHARPSSEPQTQARAVARELTRLLDLVDQHGHLHAQPSPVTGELVIAVYHLPPTEPGVRGDRVDVFYTRAAIRAQLLAPADPELRTLPNRDTCPLQQLTITDAGRAWLSAHRVPGVTAQLTRLDSRPYRAAYPAWQTASWSGTSRTR